MILASCSDCQICRNSHCNCSKLFSSQVLEQSIELSIYSVDIPIYNWDILQTLSSHNRPYRLYSTCRKYKNLQSSSSRAMLSGTQTLLEFQKLSLHH